MLWEMAAQHNVEIRNVQDRVQSGQAQLSQTLNNIGED